MKFKFWRRTILAGVCLLFAGTATAWSLDWAALNPEFRGATYVNDDSLCLDCHADALHSYDKTIHARLAAFGPGTARTATNCESCHGPRSEHVENPTDAHALSAQQQEAVCLTCHQGADRMYWKSGLHNAAGLTCSSCHIVMEPVSQKALLSRATEQATCYSCHPNVRGQMQKAYRHPVREGQIDCSSCHQVHGTPNRGMLVGASVNETCYACHQEKRGPFLWEHAPVRENCLTCHEPHGSNNPDLLTAKGPAQCVSCHQYGGHINQFRYNRVSTPYAQGCANCHVTVHGSNHPSGAKFNR
jgi:DmsE family decaheme c-type cytochrome